MKTYIFQVLSAVGLLLLASPVCVAEPHDFSEIRDLRKLWATPQCEMLLRQTYLDACRSINGSKFSEILPRAAALSFRAWATSDGTFCQLTLKTGIVLVKGGPSHTLSVDIGKKEDGTAYCLEVSLTTEFAEGRSPGLKGIEYPEGSLVGEVLKTAHFQNKLAKNSCVASISLSYGKTSTSTGSAEESMCYTADIVVKRKDKTGKLGEPNGYIYQALSGMDQVVNISDERSVLPAGENVFRSTVLEFTKAITPPGVSPAIWVLVE